MAINPGLIVAAAGLAVAGFQVYHSVAGSEQIVNNAMERYNDEKLNYYMRQKQAVKVLMELGETKLRLWHEFGRLARIYSTGKNMPNLITYKGLESFHAGMPQMDYFLNLAATVDKIHALKWDEPGTGILMAVALYGRTMTQRVEPLKPIKVGNFPETKENHSLLDAVVQTKPEPHSTNGTIEEAAVMSEILSIPEVLEISVLVKKELAAKEVTKADKEDAIILKDKIDWQSLKLADAVGRMDRVAECARGIQSDLDRLQVVLMPLLEKLENVVKIKRDYHDFTEEEKSDYMMAALLQRALRINTRIDLLLKRGHLCVINSLSIHDGAKLAASIIPPVPPQAKPKSKKELKTSAQESKAPAQEPEASAQESKAPAQELEASAQEPEAPAQESKASAQEPEA